MEKEECFLSNGTLTLILFSTAYYYMVKIFLVTRKPKGLFNRTLPTCLGFSLFVVFVCLIVFETESYESSAGLELPM